jgi:hypothetical protein
MSPRHRRTTLVCSPSRTQRSNSRKWAETRRLCVRSRMTCVLSHTSPPSRKRVHWCFSRILRQRYCVKVPCCAARTKWLRRCNREERFSAFQLNAPDRTESGTGARGHPSSTHPSSAPAREKTEFTYVLFRSTAHDLRSAPKPRSGSQVVPPILHNVHRRHGA